MKFSLRWEWGGWSVLTNGKSPESIFKIIYRGGGRGAVWNETRNIRKIFFSSPMPAPWKLDTFETNYKMATSDSEGSISTILWKLGVCERPKE